MFLQFGSPDQADLHTPQAATAMLSRAKQGTNPGPTQHADNTRQKPRVEEVVQRELHGVRPNSRTSGVLL